MKLISLNIEGRRHYERIVPFLEREQADAVCLMEAPADSMSWLEPLGYTPYFLPTLRKRDDEQSHYEGVLLASKALPTCVTMRYYHRQADPSAFFDTENKRDTESIGFISADIDGFQIVTTHFTWTPRGEVPSEWQKVDLQAMFDLLDQEQPHILCGDMNIPRHHSSLYERFLERYTDTIPQQYKSSLDKQYHRCGDSKDHTHLFSDFMVDYIFMQPPYRAENVRLEFGLSDHAGVIADIILP